MADCLHSERTCNLVSDYPAPALLWTTHDEVSVHKWFRKRSRPRDGLLDNNSFLLTSHLLVQTLLG
jgi:hypothetical protein